MGGTDASTIGAAPTRSRKIRDQERQVSGPLAGPMEPEDVVDSQGEHNDVHRALWDFRDQARPCHVRVCSNFSHGTPMHRPTRAGGEGGGNLPGQGVSVIRRAHACDSRLADH